MKLLDLQCFLAVVPPPLGIMPSTFSLPSLVVLLDREGHGHLGRTLELDELGLQAQGLHLQFDLAGLALEAGILGLALGLSRTEQYGLNDARGLMTVMIVTVTCIIMSISMSSANLGLQGQLHERLRALCNSRGC